MIQIPVTIPSTVEKYDVIIGSDILKRLEEIINLDLYTKVVIITDSTLEKVILPSLLEGLSRKPIVLQILPGEQAKSMETVAILLKRLIEAQGDRKSVILNLGGGVITDLGGFVASLYMRGIDFIQIPTTLLAQVDASVGGKTGVNFGGIKNSIGTFNQPKLVLIDTNTLKTLPDREFISGFAEILKHGFIKDFNYLKLCSAKKPRDFNDRELTEIIEQSVRIKAEIVVDDVRETGTARKLLNFGHTIGHAIEATMLEHTTPLLHGEAIALGMVAEAKLSELLGLLLAENFLKVKEVLVNAGLPTSIPATHLESITAKMLLDKKNVGGVIKFTLLTQIGEAVANKEATTAQIQKALESITQ